MAFDAGDFAECLIHLQIIPSNNGKLISVGFSSLALACGSLPNSVDPRSARLQAFGHTSKRLVCVALCKLLRSGTVLALMEM